MHEIDPKQLTLSPSMLFADDWMLLGAGTEKTSWNTMTVSWGQLGSLWGHGGGMPTAIVYVRPQRYTKLFMDSNEYFTLCAFGPEHKRDLAYLGTHSGKDEDKVKKTSLHPLFFKEGPYFQEAKLVLVCKTLYQAPIVAEGFKDKRLIEDNYPNNDFHDMYIGEIVKVIVSD